jgi:uridylate kinase
MWIIPMQKDQTFIISLGGSLVSTVDGINWPLLKNFRALILKEIGQGKRFFIIVGGGKTSRNYVAAANKIVKIGREDQDWLGIHATRLNAHLLRTIFRAQAYPAIIKDPTKKIKTDKKIIVAAGWHPGASTDYVAVELARQYGIKTIINLSNIDYVYNKDPRAHQDVRKYIDISWSDFIKIVGTKWDPGLNAPFDPVAAQTAKKMDLTVAIMNGKNLKNLQNYLNNKKFVGTTIKP